MKLSDFHYELPEHLIAQHPLKEREEARLLVVDRTQKKIHHDVFSNLKKYLPLQSTIVINDSKVIPARLLGRRKTGGAVEIFLLKKTEKPNVYETLIRPLRRIKLGEKIFFNGGEIYAKFLNVEKRLVVFNKRDIGKYLNQIGHMPLPPYIKREDLLLDREYYQTVYAKKDGSVAAPTAGLHFTHKLLNELKNDGHAFAKVTLHVNHATFKPVEEQDITRHPMHFEDYEISAASWKRIQKNKGAGKKVVAVGTTSCRVLETVAQTENFKGSTNLFIYPGFQFQMTDTLITNFHLPHSTLLMLVYAFGGKELMQAAYRQAIRKKYRFYSYGDAMIII